MPLEGTGHHIIDQTMLIGQARCGVLVFVFVFEHFGERIFELAVVGLENRVLGGKIHRIAAHQTIVEARAGETTDGIVHIVLHLGHAAVGAIVVHDMLDRLGTIFRSEGDGERACPRNLEISGLILVAERMSGYHDRFGPAGNQTRNVAHHDRLAENGSAENIANGAIGGLPHLLQAEFLDTRLVRRDGGALHADMLTLDGLRRVDGHLIVGSIAVFDAEIVIFEIHVEVRKDQAILDVFPDDAGHFVAVEFDDLAFDLDFGHVLFSCRD